MEERILGLDVSSEVVGWALFEGERLVRRGKHAQQGEKHGERLYRFYLFLTDLLQELKPSQVVVEAPFSAGRGKAFAVLIRYFGIVEVAHFQHFNVLLPKANCLQPRAVKDLLEVPTSKDHLENKKLMVKEINRRYGLTLRFHPRNKSRSDDDIADAIAVVHAWYERLKRPDVRRCPTKRNRNRSGTKQTASRRR